MQDVLSDRIIDGLLVIGIFAGKAAITLVGF